MTENAKTFVSPSLRSLLPAFTLAEVLITLGIIGVVAAMTIPTLMNKMNDLEFKTAYKKSYATASQARLMAYNNGELTECDNWGDWSGGTCNADNFAAFKKELKVTKDCGTDTASCWDMTGEKSWGGVYPTLGAPAFIDASGVAWSKNMPSPAAEVLLDTNGSKKPNQYGKDRAILILGYHTTATSGTKLLTNPIVVTSGDMTDSSNAEQVYRCPSIATHPCYYDSWITGAK